MRLRLKSVFAFTTFIGIALAFAGMRFQQRERKIAEGRHLDRLCERVSVLSVAISRRGFNDVLSGKKERKNSIADWITGRFSADDIIAVCLDADNAIEGGTDAIREVFRQLVNFPSVEEIELRGDVHDGDIRDIVRSCPNVITISAESTELGDNSLAEFALLPQLETLNANWTKMRGEFRSSSTPPFERLRIARFSCSPITDRGLLAIARCRAIEELYIPATRVSLDGLKCLALPALPKLRHLSIGEVEGVEMDQAGKLAEVLLVLKRGRPNLVVDCE